MRGGAFSGSSREHDGVSINMKLEFVEETGTG